MSDDAHARSAPPIDGGPTEFQRVQESDAFQQLRRRHRSFVFPVAIGFLVWYFAYVLLADYAHDFMATPVFGNINVGLLLGLGQFVTTFAITTWYVYYANRRLDPLAGDLRDQLAESERLASGGGRASDAAALRVDGAGTAAVAAVRSDQEVSE